MTVNPSPQRLGFLGQSFAAPFLRAPLKGQLQNALLLRFSTVTINGHAVDGSSSDRTHNADPKRYWWDLARNQPGPAMTTWLAGINALPVSQRPNLLFVNLGEGDSMWSIPGSEAPAEIDVYDRAMRAIFAAARAACSPTAPDNVFILLYIIGRRIFDRPVAGVQAIREAQLRMLFGPRAVKNAYNLASIFDVELLGELDPAGMDSHPTTAGYSAFLRRMVDRLLWMRGIGSQMALRASLPRQLAADTLTVDFAATTATSISMPAVPYGIALRSGADVWTGGQLAYAWQNLAVNKKRLSIKAPRAISGTPTLMYPYGQLMDLDRERLIVDHLGEPVEPFLFDVEAPIVTDEAAAAAIDAAFPSRDQALYQLGTKLGLITKVDAG